MNNIDMSALLTLVITFGIHLVAKYLNNMDDYKDYRDDIYKQKIEISQKIINNEYVTEDEYMTFNDNVLTSREYTRQKPIDIGSTY
jgi:hypothetical protein